MDPHSGIDTPCVNLQHERVIVPSCSLFLPLSTSPISSLSNLPVSFPSPSLLSVAAIIVLCLNIGCFSSIFLRSLDASTPGTYHNVCCKLSEQYCLDTCAC